MAQNLPGALIRPTLQSGLKKIGRQKKSGMPYFQAPNIHFFSFLKFDPYFAIILNPILVDAKLEAISSNFTYEKMRKKSQLRYYLFQDNNFKTA